MECNPVLSHVPTIKYHVESINTCWLCIPLAGWSGLLVAKFGFVVQPEQILIVCLIKFPFGNNGCLWWIVCSKGIPGTHCESCRKVVQQRRTADLNMISCTIKCICIVPVAESVSCKSCTGNSSVEIISTVIICISIERIPGQQSVYRQHAWVVDCHPMEFETAVVGFAHVLLLVKIHCTTSPSAKPETVKYGLFNPESTPFTCHW